MVGPGTFTPHPTLSLPPPLHSPPNRTALSLLCTLLACGTGREQRRGKEPSQYGQCHHAQREGDKCEGAPFSSSQLGVGQGSPHSCLGEPCFSTRSARQAAIRSHSEWLMQSRAAFARGRAGEGEGSYSCKHGCSSQLVVTWIGTTCIACTQQHEAQVVSSCCEVPQVKTPTRELDSLSTLHPPPRRVKARG